MVVPVSGAVPMRAPPAVRAVSTYDVGVPPPAPGLHDRLTVLPETLGGLSVGGECQSDEAGER